MLRQLRNSLGEVLGCLRNRKSFVTAGVFLGIAIPLAFCAYTQPVWEDFLITYRFSENLARGHGLVFSLGERVHGFTSVINTLLPAAVAWVTNAEDYRIPLLVFRIASLSGLLIALISICSALQAADRTPTRWGTWQCFLFPLLVALEVKITAFTVNGQEAGFMLGFLAVAFSLVWFGWAAHWLLGGICFAGLMYTRPDGFVFIAILAGAALLFSSESRRDTLSGLAKAALLAALLYAPWLAFTWSYYGSPIPHTITAKQGIVSAPAIASGFALFGSLVAAIAGVAERLCGAFGAIYDYVHIGGPAVWPRWSHDIAFVLETIAVTWWLVPTTDRLGRAASFIAMGILGYLCVAGTMTVTSPWYYPPLSFFSILSLVRVIAFLPTLVKVRPIGQGLAIGLGVALCGLLMFIFVFSARSIRIKQEIVDGGNRRAIGEWLRRHVENDETVYVECLGYIGYFSQKKILEWPGLVSPAVVEARKKIGRPASRWGDYLWGKVAEELKPDWLVARPAEVDQIASSPLLAASYRAVQVFDVSQQVLAQGIFYGSVYAQYDSQFVVFKKIKTGVGSQNGSPPSSH